MMLKAIVFATLAVAVLGDDFSLGEDKRVQMREILREYCKKNNAEDKFEDVQNAGKVFIDCLKGLVNVETLQNEIEEAKPNGALDEVFKKYCAKTPQLKTCIQNLFDGMSPCLSNEAREKLPVAMNGTTQLIDFVCYKDGDRIALFIAEGGPQCFQSKANDIRECGAKIKESFPSIEAAKSLGLAGTCGKWDEVTSCIVNKLETCETPTPGNMAESLFNFVRRATPCNTVEKKN
ncbi:27 kDa hemolymph protein-like [Spodoptera litura]|uniref:27 kDa hemolymph protein-like n=1 Tax=Spodoptera litura TaxID=69820 RepID=A0A9J7IJ81_SPOLT|nr:27 kDa hemolymph protein-like [Spodoptera litura]